MSAVEPWLGISESVVQQVHENMAPSFRFSLKWWKKFMLQWIFNTWAGPPEIVAMATFFIRRPVASLPSTPQQTWPNTDDEL